MSGTPAKDLFLRPMSGTQPSMFICSSSKTTWNFLIQKMTTLRRIQETPWTCTWIQAPSAVVWVKRPVWSSDKQPHRKLWEESDYISLVHIDGTGAETILTFLLLIDWIESKKKSSHNWFEEENNPKIRRAQAAYFIQRQQQNWITKYKHLVRTQAFKITTERHKRHPWLETKTTEIINKVQF